MGIVLRDAKTFHGCKRKTIGLLLEEFPMGSKGSSTKDGFS